MASNEQPIILKKVKKVVHGHHGGAWKIAYADFVTAMMAFFLLMWLISMTTPEQKQGLADYFAPSNVSRSTSGAGGIMGGTAFDETGARMPGTKPQVVMTISTPAQPKSPELAEKEAKRAAEMNELMQQKSMRDAKNFQSAAESIR
ncbi:MAG TPA: chemotaxis protein MotB, partial [Rhodobiaceae bacterium]|nr:chemotaxis protein MotB [Rhodobiaceae bacterium]